jgi:hypothetical protein
LVDSLIVAEQLFRNLFNLLGFPGNVPPSALFNSRSTEEDSMKKFGLMIAALATIAIAAPSIASAETVVIKRGGGHHGFGARAQMHRDGMHRGMHHHDRVVVIKKRHRY